MISSSNPKKQDLSVFLALDFGLTYLGVALGNSISRSAHPLCVIKTMSSKERFQKITEIIAQWAPDALVLGVPRYSDGQANEMTAQCEKFARQLHGRYGLPIFQVDERYSSVQAQANFSSKTSSNSFLKHLSLGSNQYVQRLDDHAACVILEQFFLENYL